ncbi:MAG: hypothetical protein ACREBE_22405, partial [bacterium]
MGEYNEVLVDGFAGGILLLALLTVAFIRRRSRMIVHALNDTSALLTSLRDDTGDRPARLRGSAQVHARSRLLAAVREHVVRSDGERIVLSRPLPTLRREYAEDEVGHSFSFSFGGVFTGLALVATFVLIALVMT